MVVGDRREVSPARGPLLAAVNRVIAPPETTFVAVQFANDAEDLE